jgi:hypothetical protein
MVGSMLAGLSLDGFRFVRAGAWRRGLLGCLLVASSLGLALPVGIQSVCDPAQCQREGQGLAAHANDASETNSDCSGPFHLCHCCAHVQLLAQRAGLGIAPAHLSGRQLLAAQPAGDLAGHSAPLLRPPSTSLA